MEYTVVHGKNRVSQYNSIDGVHRDTKGEYLVLNKNGRIIERSAGAVITWPDSATDGLQAIVDVKEGTLFFIKNYVCQINEFVVSEYVAPVDVGCKWCGKQGGGHCPDCGPVMGDATYAECFGTKHNHGKPILGAVSPHVFDLVDNWPQQHRGCLGTMPLPEGWEWKWFGDDWVLSNGTIGLKREDWFKYKFGDAEPAKQFEPFVSVEDSAPVHVLDLIKEWPMNMPPQHELESVDGHKWEYVHGKWVLSSKVSDREFHEGHWLNYHENKKKYAEDQPVVTAASMLTAALGHMEDRAKTYDAPGGERSMGKTVSAFNTITGLELTEEQGWLFMEILKQVRSQQGNYRADNYEDMVAYAALRGECAARERGNKSC